MYRHMTWEECETRYPRLVQAMKWVACLSTTEACAALRDYRDGRHAMLSGRSPYSTGEGNWDAMRWRIWGNDLMKYGGGEAVSHFGGPIRAIKQAIKTRPATRKRWHGGY